MDNLYREHNSWLKTWLRRRLGCSEIAADLAHDTFVRLIRQKREPLYVNDLREPRTYLARVARRLMIDRHRRQVVENAYLEMLTQQPELAVISAEESSIVLETLIAIDSMLNELKPLVKETFLLSRFDGLTYSEIGNKLGISHSTVRKYMLIALQACSAAGE